MKTVMILGAGVSRAAGGKKSLSNRPPLDADFFQIAKAAIRRGHDSVMGVLHDLVGDYSNTLSNSLEASVAYLFLKAVDSTAGSIYHRGFINILLLLNVLLAKTTNEISISPRSLLYRFLLSELRKVDKPEDLSIITFNYDLLVERVFDEIAVRNGNQIFSFPGCYRLSDIESTPNISGSDPFSNISKDHVGVPILKLHGSLNWQSKHTSELPRPSALFHPSRALFVMNSPKIASSLSWRPGSRTVYMKPIIVPPVSGKRNMMHNSITELWQKAGKALVEADRVIVAGYSCPPLDIEARILLSESLRQNSSKKLYVIDPNHQSAANFIEICGVDHSTIYTSIKDWVRDSK